VCDPRLYARKIHDMKRRVDVRDLSFGMYIAELDRPWAETPFLFQGFELRNPDELEQLKRHCQYVYIDTEQGESPEKEGGTFAQRKGSAFQDQTTLEEEIEEAKQSNSEARDVMAQTVHMKEVTRWLALFVIVVGVLAGFYYWQQRTSRETAPPPSITEAQPAPEAESEPPIRHPIERTQSSEATEPLPTLDESEKAAQGALDSLFGQKTVRKFFRVDDFVRHLVVTIDNLPRKQVPLRYVPVNSPARRFLASGEEDTLILNPDNYRRYTPYVRLAETLDVKKFAVVYVYYYPLFQQAYEELGYPSGYFNDRLIEVIDDLLAAPDVQAPIRLIQPKVMYQFADPELEARSAGQKIMIRMGSENAARIKAKLHEVRRELTSEPPIDLPAPARPDRRQG